MTTMTASSATVKRTRTIFDASTLRAAYKWNFGYGLAPRVYVAPEKARAIVDALVNASAPVKAATPAVGPVSVRQWPTDSEVESRWIETTFSANEVAYARLTGVSFAEARHELQHEDQMLVAMAAEYDAEHPQAFEPGEFDEARLSPAVLTEEETRRPAPKRHKRNNVAKALRMAVVV